MGQQYNLQGFYFSDGTRGQLAGNLEISTSGFIRGVIVDEASEVKVRKILGKIEKTNDNINLDFLVVVPSEKLLNLRYNFKKDGNDSAEGKYSGIWYPEEKEISSSDPGGMIDLPSGDFCFCRPVVKLKVRPENNILQGAEIYLSKVL